MEHEAFVCFDLGDTIMVEETEKKDAEATTQTADLIPGLADLIRDLHAQGVMLGLVADTRPGTYRHVLRQHGLFDLFQVFSISEELGVSKPHRRMFDHAREEAGLLGFAGRRLLMVGNHYHRDIAGGKAAGFDTCWFYWNSRYPGPEGGEAGAADGVVTNADELRRFIDGWLARARQSA